MDEIRTKLESEVYKNRVKSTLGMGMTKTAVETYALQKITAWTDLHLDLNSACWCKQCDPRQFEINCKIIASLHQNKQNPTLNWKNVTNLHGVRQPWHVAKLFLPTGNERNNGPQDTDLSGMINLMFECVLFTNMKQRTLKKLRTARNTVFHSSNYCVTTQEMTNYFDDMNLFLQHAANDPDIEQNMKLDITAKQAELKKLKDSNMKISMYEDAYKLKRDGIYQDFEERICAGDLNKVREILQLIEDIGVDIERLRNLQRNEEDIKEYKSKVKELEVQLKKIKQKEEVQKELIRSVSQKALGLGEQHAQLKRDVESNLNEHRTESRIIEVELEVQLEKLKQKEEMQNELIRSVSQKALGLGEQHAQLKRDVESNLNERRTENRNIKVELEVQLEKLKQKEEVQKELIRSVSQKALGLGQQHDQLKRDVESNLNEHGTESRNIAVGIHSRLQEVLYRHTQDILQVRGTISVLEQEFVNLREYVPKYQEQFTGILDCLRPKLSAWQHALRNEASRLEAECLIVVVMVVIGMSLVLRVCLLFERLG